MIRTLGSTLLVLSPWDDPVALTRAWCLWEVLATLQHEAAPLALLLPPAQARAALQGLESSWQRVLGVLERVDVARAVAYDARDEAMIHAAVAETLGVPSVNALVLERLRAWLLALAEESWAGRGAPAAAQLARAVARLRFLQGRHSDAEAAWRAVLAASALEHGADAAATCDAQVALGEVLTLRNQRDEAGAAYGAAIEAHERRGDADSAAGVGRARIKLADLLRSRCRNAEACVEAARASAELDAALGGTHLEALQARLTWAVALNFNGDADGAEAHLREARAALRESTHAGAATSTATAAFRLGELLGNRGDAAAAMLHFREALAFFTTAWGAAHMTTRLVATSLGALLLDDECDDGDAEMTPAARAARSAEALAIMRDVEPACRALMGDTNPNTLYAIGILGSAHLAAGDAAAAAPLLEESLSGWQAQPGGAASMVVAALLAKSDLCVARGEPALAVACATEAREITARFSARGSGMARRTADTLARVLTAAGRHAEAVALLEEALSGPEAVDGGEEDPSSALLRRSRRARLERCRAAAAQATA
jgi:tetratricopeptide (TPR) repeat protein